MSNNCELFKNKEGAVFVAWDDSERKDGSQIACGFAFCNPKDLPNSGVSKKQWIEIGKKIAYGRLNKAPIWLGKIEINDSYKKSIRKELKNIILQIGYFPEKAYSKYNIKEYQGKTFSNSGDFIRWLYLFVVCLSSSY